MSQTVALGGLGLSALSQLLGSRSRLQQASFRGVPFLVDADEGIAGRRLVVHEFAFRDTPYTEDLGRLPRHFRLTAFVIDPLPGTLPALYLQPQLDFIDQRDALLTAIDGFDTAATLVHPTMGQLTCRAATVRWREQLAEGFGACEFVIEFIEDGPAAAPFANTSTASALLAGVAAILPLISAAYETVVLAVVSPGILLEQVAAAMLVAPPGTIAGLAAAIGAVAAQPQDLAATAGAVQAATQAMAANVLGLQPAPPAPDDPVAGIAFAAAPPADPSGGLATLAAWGATLPAAGGAQGAQQRAVVSLVQGSATAALAQVYAQIAWPYAAAATAARAQLLALLDAQVEAAAAAGADDLYRGWRALSALAMADMIARAQALPVLGSYAVPEALPSVALAQLLYADPTRAPQLESLNDVAQPLFMPASGVALTT